MKLDQNSFMEDNRGERFTPWTSYSDMFCSLLMIFVLLFAFIMLQYVTTKAKTALELTQAQSEVESLSFRIGDAEARKDEAEAQLIIAQGELDGVKETLTATQTDLDNVTVLLGDKEAELDDVKGQLAARDKELSDNQVILTATQQDLDAANAELTKTKTDLSSTQVILKETQGDLESVRADLGDSEERLAALQIVLTDTESELASTKSALTQTQSDLDSVLLVLADSEDDLTNTKGSVSSMQEEIDTTQAALIAVQAELDETSTALAQAESERDEALKLLESQDNSGLQTTLVLTQGQLDATRSELATTQAELEEKDQQLLVIQEELDLLKSDDSVTALNARVDELESELTEQQDAFRRVAGIRLDIITYISGELRAQAIDHKVDWETGSIVMSSEMLFQVNQSTLLDEGKRFLDSFFPAYFETLMHGEYADSIAQIVIEGHTDTQGEYLTNMTLSTRRAEAVLNYCYDLIKDSPEDEALFIEMVASSGRSFSDPIYKADGVTVDADASRRVEIKFTLRDDAMIEQMDEIIAGGK